MTRLLLAGGAAAATDLGTYARRIARHDAEAVLRVVAGEGTAAFFAQTPFQAVAARAVALREPVRPELDVVLEAATLAARAAGGGDPLELPPPVPALRWTAGLPPRSGWRETARLPSDRVSQAVGDGVAEFRRRAVEVGAGRPGAGAVLESLAADVWSRELAGGVPVRLAHAADSYGFLGGGDVVLRAAGPWHRLDAAYGSVFAREAVGLGLLF